MKLGQLIKQRRKELGLSQTELAEKVGVTCKATVSKVELGDDNLTINTLKRYAEALDVTLDYFFTNTNRIPRAKSPLELEEDELKRNFDWLSPENRKLILDLSRALIRAQN